MNNKNLKREKNDVKIFTIAKQPKPDLKKLIIYYLLPALVVKGILTDIKKPRVSKSIVHVIKHLNFQLYMVHPDRVI